MSKLCIYGVIIQISVYTLAFATDVKAQHKSVNEIQVQIDFDAPVDFNEVINTIEESTDFHFAFMDHFISQSTYTLNLDSGDQMLGDVLLDISKQTDLVFRRRNDNIYILKKESEDIQPIMEVMEEYQTVIGKVVDEKGESLPGATVLEKGTTNGTVTDVDGNFSIDIESGAVLTISFVGYLQKEIAVSSETEITITMLPDLNNLDEIVVIGYGSQSKRNVTGSISRVDMEDTENLPNINVSQALRGRVAGVQFTDSGRPGQSGSILVRGPRSLSGGNSPLIILDGIYFNGGLSEISPNDIESIEVLKDASASAIYGARAANGVIIITSKKGTRTDKATINANFYYGISDWTKQLELLSPEEYLQKSRDIRDQRGIAYDLDDVGSYLSISEAENYHAGKITNPYDLISQQGKIMSGDINISGQANKANYFVSTSYSKEKGLVLDDNFERLSFRVNLENEVAEWFTIGTNSMFSHNDQSGVPASIDLVARQSPYGTWFRADGSPTQFTVPEDQISRNPLRENHLERNSYLKDNLFGSFYGIFSVPQLEGLSLRINYSNNYRWIKDYNFEKQDIYLPNTNTSSASKRHTELNDRVLENILKYEFDLGSDHLFDITMMYGGFQNAYETTTARASQLSTDIFGWNKLELGDMLTSSSDASETSGISSMARINYTFKNRYLFTLTARRDGSSVFASNNKYATFPSGAFSWIATEESFLQGTSFLDFLKLRASYGAVGNQAISPYQSLSLAETNYYVFGDEGTAIGIYPDNIANNDLKWETTYITNLGIDFRLFNNRIDGTIEFYNMQTKDLLVERSIPVMTGYSSIWTNLGQVDNRGIELSLNTLNVQQGKFEWRSGLVFSHNMNEIVSLYGYDNDGDGKEDDDIGNGWFIGHPIDSYYDYVFDGIYQEGDELPAGYKAGFARFKDLNGDGEIDAQNDRKIVGSGGQPKYRYGITNSFRYGNFELSVFINAMQGWTATFNDMDHYDDSIDPIRPANMLDFGWWTSENQSNTRPSLEYSRSVLGHNWYASRNFVRVQDVTLSYSFSEDFLRSKGISGLSVFVSGKNLATFTKWPGTNPESPSSDRYPIARTVSTGLRLSF